MAADEATHCTPLPLGYGLVVSFLAEEPHQFEAGTSSCRREQLLDLFHEQIAKPRLPQVRKTLKDDRLPRFSILHKLLTAILQIKCLRFVDTIEEHERMSAVRVEPNLVRRERDGLVGGCQSRREIAR